MVEAVFLQPAELEVLDHDIRLQRQRLDLRPVGLVAEVGDHPGLAPVAAVEIGGRDALLPFDEGRTPVAGVVAVRRLDLDDLGAEVGQHLPGPGTGEDAREFEDAEAGERGCHLVTFLAA